MAALSATLPAARMALAAAREEATLLSAELASASRSGGTGLGAAAGHAIESSAQAEVHALNPTVIRQAAREAGGESSFMARLSHPPSASSPPPVQSLSTASLESTLSSPSAASGPSTTLETVSSLSSSSSSAASSSTASTIRLATRESSAVARAIEQDLGATLREVLSNAGQQGVEEMGEQVPLSQVVQELQAQGGLQAMTEAQAVGG